MPWKMSGEKPKTVVASRSLIKEFVEMEPVPYDRPLSERRVAVYRRILASGEFRPVTWASVHCKETNCVYRVNGKHTSVMLSTMNPIPEFYVTIERYTCDTLQDAASLYNTFDSKLATRTANDMNAAFAATIPELKEVRMRVVNFTVGAASFKKWGDKAKEVPAAERAEELMDAYPFAKWLVEVLGTNDIGTGSPSRFIARQPVVNAMMATWDRAPVKAKEFWTLVRDETDPDRYNPTRVLAIYLRSSSLGKTRTTPASGMIKQTDNREMYVKCLHAWNAWRRGETTKLAYHATADYPDVSK